VRDESITTLPWPVRSPDLTSIEYIWGIIGRRVKERTPPVQTLNDLEQKLKCVILAKKKCHLKTIDPAIENSII
jgi:transposase